MEGGPVPVVVAAAVKQPSRPSSDAAGGSRPAPRVRVQPEVVSAPRVLSPTATILKEDGGHVGWGAASDPVPLAAGKEGGAGGKDGGADSGVRPAQVVA